MRYFPLLKIYFNLLLFYENFEGNDFSAYLYDIMKKQLLPTAIL